MNVLPGDYVLFNTGLGYRLLGTACFAHKSEGNRSLLTNLITPPTKIRTKPEGVDNAATVARVELRPLHVYDETAARIDGLPVTLVAAYVPNGWDYNTLKTSMIASKLIYDDEQPHDLLAALNRMDRGHPRRSNIYAAEEMIRGMPADERRLLFTKLMYLMRG